MFQIWRKSHENLSPLLRYSPLCRDYFFQFIIVPGVRDSFWNFFIVSSGVPLQIFRGKQIRKSPEIWSAISSKNSSKNFSQKYRLKISPVIFQDYRILTSNNFDRDNSITLPRFNWKILSVIFLSLSPVVALEQCIPNFFDFRPLEVNIF